MTIEIADYYFLYVSDAKILIFLHIPILFAIFLMDSLRISFDVIFIQEPDMKDFFAESTV